MVTDRRRLGAEADDALLQRIGLAARAGLHLIQIRERDLADGALLALVSRAVDAVRGTRARVLVNDRADVAVAAGAHGVHLRSDSVPAARVRRMVPRGFLIGRSVHDAEEAVRAAEGGELDYLLFGTVFETSSKPGRASGVGALARVVGQVARLPVLAIGGVTLGNRAELAATGCAGFAAIGMFAECDRGSLPEVAAAAAAPWENRN
jgi:thiamine-phosphate pyrophosphorylase